MGNSKSKKNKEITKKSKEIAKLLVHGLCSTGTWGTIYCEKRDKDEFNIHQLVEFWQLELIKKYCTKSHCKQYLYDITPLNSADFVNFSKFRHEYTSVYHTKNLDDYYSMLVNIHFTHNYKIIHNIIMNSVPNFYQDIVNIIADYSDFYLPNCIYHWCCQDCNIYKGVVHYLIIQRFSSCCDILHIIANDNDVHNSCFVRRENSYSTISYSYLNGDYNVTSFD